MKLILALGTPAIVKYFRSHGQVYLRSRSYFRVLQQCCVMKQQKLQKGSDFYQFQGFELLL